MAFDVIDHYFSHDYSKICPALIVEHYSLLETKMFFICNNS